MNGLIIELRVAETRSVRRGNNILSLVGCQGKLAKSAANDGQSCKMYQILASNRRQPCKICTIRSSAVIRPLPGFQLQLKTTCRVLSEAQFVAAGLGSD